MLETVWQQAGLADAVVSTVAEHRPEEPWGQVLVGFASARAALRCAAHFHGCQWDASGMEVTTEAFEDGTKDTALTGLSAQELLALPQGWSLPLEGDYELFLNESEFLPQAASSAAWAPGDMSVDAPAFVPTQAAGSGLSAEAPSFVPARKPRGRTHASKVKRGSTLGAIVECDTGTEPSTDTGESGDEDNPESGKTSTA